MKSIGLVPTNTLHPTHFTATNSSLLDVFFVNNINKAQLYDQLSAPCFSKHDLIFLSYDFHLNYVYEKITYPDFRKINYERLYYELWHVDWSLIYYMPSVDDQLTSLEQQLTNICEKSVPVKVLRKDFKKKPWFNSEIKSAIINRDFAYKRWKYFKTDALYTEFKIARRKVNTLIRNAKFYYYSNRFSSAVSTSETWRTIRDIGIGKSSPLIPNTIDVNTINESFTRVPNISPNLTFYDQIQGSTVDSSPFCFEPIYDSDVISSCQAIKSNATGFDGLNPKFLRIIMPYISHYVTYIFNNIITKCIYPKSWKFAKIIPIPKSNGEYRPIAILPFISKIFERIINQQIIKYINENSLLTDRQSGFRPKHSCLTSLIDVSEDIRQRIDVGDISYLVLLDHSKAFDMVDHRVLCFKLLRMFNFSKLSVQLISSYLSDRHQSVFANATTSCVLPVSKGVPQGSILGPLLFSLYANDLPKQLKYCKVHMYADDVQLNISASINNVHMCIQNLNSDLQSVSEWAKANGLCLNPSKSKCLVVAKKTMVFSQKPDILLNNEKIRMVSTAKNLGITFNSSLTWSDHINCVSGKTYAMLRTLWGTQNFTPLKTRILLAKTYIMPRLLYGCEIFSNCDYASRNKLLKTYNSVLRYVFGLGRYDHISNFSKKLYGVSLLDLLNIRTLIMLHKIIFTRQPVYLYERLVPTRSERTNDLQPIRYINSVSKWQFYVNSIRLWNSLPSSVKVISNAKHFRKQIFKLFMAE